MGPALGGSSLGAAGQARGHYNYFRDYDPRIGRYIESDPIGLEGGISTYAYVYADPAASIDPTGLAPNDRKFGINDKGFWKWWEQNKYDWGPFDGHEGYNPAKPHDIPNKEIAEKMLKEYEDCERRANGGRGNGRDERPNLKKLLRRLGRGGTGGTE